MRKQTSYKKDTRNRQKEKYIYLNIIVISSAGRNDQKFISRYFPKLYRFHGI